MSAFARPAPVRHHVHSRRLSTLPLVLVVATLAIALSAVGAANPAPAFGLSTFVTRCDGVTLRSRPSTSATALASLSKGIKVVAVDKVSGGSWRTSCAGTTATGSSWYKITVANGKDVNTRFGLSAVYGASSLFQRLSTDTPTSFTDGRTVRVSSIRALLATLADNSVSKIVVANGTYGVSSRQLLIDGRFARRTRPVLVRAETIGGVTFSGRGATGWLGLHFTGGAHDQTWQGFRFANAEPTQTGVIVFGRSGSVTPVPPHHITLRDITINESITSDNPAGMSGDHAVYFSSTTTPMHDLVIDRLTVKAATSGLDSALHFYTQPALGPGPRNVIVSRMTVTGTDQAVIFWDASLRNITVSDSTITGAKVSAVRYERGGTVTLRNVVSSKSGQHGFYSSLGSRPPGVTFSNTSLR